MSAYDFSDLSVRQQALLTDGGWRPGCGRKQPPLHTVRKLIERGLVVESSTSIAGVKVPVYEVPAEVKAAWEMER